MAYEQKKVSEVPTASNVASTDRILVLRDPSGNASVRTVPFGTVSANLIVNSSAPANSSANGLAGHIAYDSDYIYICTANNTWKRASITTW